MAPARSFATSPAVVLPALHFLSGFSNSLPATAYKLLQVADLRLEPSEQVVLNGVVALLPWDFKIFFAFLSDWVPICRRRRIPYLAIAIALQAISKLALAAAAARPIFDFCCAEQLFSATCQVVIGVTLDALAVQSTMLERQEGRPVGDLMTNCWIGLNAGNLLGNLFGAAMQEGGGFSKGGVFQGAAAAKVLMLLLSFAVIDPPVAPVGRVCSAARSRAAELLRELAHVTRLPRVWMPVLFIYIWSLHPKFGDGMDSFMLQQPNASSPNLRGPQPLGFTPLEYALQATVGTLGAILGALAYKLFLNACELRLLFASLIVAGACISALSLLLTTGLVSSKPVTVVFAVGDNLVWEAVSLMLSMPILILTASLCPPGAVATTYALVTSIQSAGVDVASALASGLVSAFGVLQSDYSGLTALVALCCGLQLALGLPFLFLVPRRFASAEDVSTSAPSAAPPPPPSEYTPLTASKKGGDPERGEEGGGGVRKGAAGAEEAEDSFGTWLLGTIFVASVCISITRALGSVYAAHSHHMGLEVLPTPLVTSPTNGKPSGGVASLNAETPTSSRDGLFLFDQNHSTGQVEPGAMIMNQSAAMLLQLADYEEQATFATMDVRLDRLIDLFFMRL